MTKRVDPVAARPTVGGMRRRVDKEELRGVVVQDDGLFLEVSNDNLR